MSRRRKRNRKVKQITQMRNYEPRYLVNEDLRTIGWMKKAMFSKFGEAIENPDGHLYYKDNGSNILAVAHLDSAAFAQTYKIDGRRIYMPNLDDRLGAYTILKLLPSMGITMDWLLCDLEETGRTTSRYFTTEKDYNWIIEFDRSGNTAALYQYETTDLVSKLDAVGVRTGNGSFTDICQLDGLGVSGINWPICYHDYHSLNAYFYVDEYEDLIDKFVLFYNKHKDEKMVWDGINRRYSYTGYHSYGYDSQYYRKNQASVYGSNLGLAKDNYGDSWDTARNHGWDSATTPRHSDTFSVNECDHCGSEYFVSDGACPYCGTLETSKDKPSLACGVCGGISCSGLSSCGCCEFVYHSSRCINEYGICHSCLIDIYGVDKSLVQTLEYSYDPSARQNSLLLISKYLEEAGYAI